jgi:hypothetical protein
MMYFLYYSGGKRTADAPQFPRNTHCYPALHSPPPEVTSQMQTTHNEWDSREREYRLILEREVEQQEKMEDLVNRVAYVANAGEVIIFLTTLAC